MPLTSDPLLFMPTSGPAAWRRALPRIGLSESSELPPRQLAALLAKAGERVAAAELCREILETSPDDVPTLDRLATVLARLGREDDEREVRHRIASLIADRLGVDPVDRDAAIAFDLAVYGMPGAPAAPPASYVAACFDRFADSFDHRLRAELRYAGPEQVVERVRRAFGSGDGTLDICDVGCGTGLLGPLLRPYARRLEGVDVSARMLDKARGRGVYDALVEADLVSAFAEVAAAYDVVTAADVFVYLGDLGLAFPVMARALRPRGLLVFTVERADEGDYQLTYAGRYAHSAVGVRRAAASAHLVEVSIEEDIVRRERASPVHSLTCVLRRE